MGRAPALQLIAALACRSECCAQSAARIKALNALIIGIWLVSWIGMICSLHRVMGKCPFKVQEPYAHGVKPNAGARENAISPANLRVKNALNRRAAGSAGDSGWARISGKSRNSRA